MFAKAPQYRAEASLQPWNFLSTDFEVAFFRLPSDMCPGMPALILSYTA